MKPFPKFVASVQRDAPHMAHDIRLTLCGDSRRCSVAARVADELLVDSKADAVPIVARKLVKQLVRDTRFLPALESLLIDALTAEVAAEVYRPDWE
jgi:hypothetical protein